MAFVLSDPEGAQFVVFPSVESPTGWAYQHIEAANVSEMAVKGLTVVDGKGRESWRPGAFGPTAADARAALVKDIAAAVVASLPTGGGGGAAVDYDRIEKAVDRQLDQQSLGGADKDN